MTAYVGVLMIACGIILGLADDPMMSLIALAFGVVLCAKVLTR